MSKIKELYRKNIYGLMGTLIFHILLFSFFSISQLNFKTKTEQEESVLLDLSVEEKMEELPKPELEKQAELNRTSGQPASGNQQNISNSAVNDAPNKNKTSSKDKFFDADYQKDIEQAKKMVADVNKQLSKKIPQTKKFEMPEATTEGQNRDSIKNVVYSGKSNIHYYLENRYHVRLPIPVYLAKSGGEIKVDIQVDRSGRVIKAEVKSARANGDPLLAEYALQAAENTLFNADNKAPSVQKGSITYKFVAQ
ncbi:MAG TPA: TonB family protein [Candidatus Kapabacteria bacterium]|nr:TonB family protein [Candidatus Kapabacteria bacterium]